MTFNLIMIEPSLSCCSALNSLSLPFDIDRTIQLLQNLILTTIGAACLYGIVFYGLRAIFRQFERDFALVTLYVSIYPVLIVFILTGIKLTFADLKHTKFVWIDQLLVAAIIATVGYWMIQFFRQVVVYSLQEFAEQTEIMWDDVLIPLLEGVVPFLITLSSFGLILQLAFNIDLTGVWVTVGGATFIVGFATKDILANFFSGIVLLIDTPFQFGDVLKLEQGELGILKKIGLRVTQVYLFDSHTEAYIPNSVLQGQTIINLSRPIASVHFSKPILLKPEGDLDTACQIMYDIICAHPDTLGDIDTKLSCLDKYFLKDNNQYSFLGKKKNGRDRLLAENRVNLKLTEIEQTLEAMVVTLKFAERGGLNLDDIATIQEEYQNVLNLIGIQISVVRVKTRNKFWHFNPVNPKIQIKEINTSDSLISLIRDWYRIWLRDPNLYEEDQYLLPEIWEYKIEVLKRRFGQLQRKILNPSRIETRLDDNVRDLNTWLKTRFKQTRSQQQAPQVLMDKTVYGSSAIFIQFMLEYYIDDIKLENCERGDRVSSEIYSEIIKCLQGYIVGRWT